jgi:hypothetical protein
MAELNGITSEEIVSADIVSVPGPAGVCDTSGVDPTTTNIDPTNPDERTGVKGHGKPSNAGGGRG